MKEACADVVDTCETDLGVAAPEVDFGVVLIEVLGVAAPDGCDKGAEGWVRGRGTAAAAGGVGVAAAAGGL